jgi:sulfite dehydrogenase
MRLALSFLAAAALAGPAGAATGKGTPLDGRTLFRAHCGTCHTLKAAGTAGRVGPNLSYEDLKPSTVTYMAEYGDGVMPGFKGVLTRAQIHALALWVSAASS